jgi:hypothetical protein
VGWDSSICQGVVDYIEDCFLEDTPFKTGKKVLGLAAAEKSLFGSNAKRPSKALGSQKLAKHLNTVT